MLTGGVKTIGVAIRGDNASLRQALQGSKREIEDFARTTATSTRTAARDVQTATGTIDRGARQAARSLDGVGDSAERMGVEATRSLSSVGGSLLRLSGAAGIGAIASQIVSVGIGFQDFTQRTQISLETMLGSADEARTFLADILAFAKQTPFAFPDLTAAAQRLLAFGLEGDRVIETLRAIGDAAASTGQGTAMMERLATVFGQIQAKGRLQGDEILQLAEAGIPALRILANQAGVTADVFSKDVSAGLVDADTAIQGLVDGITNGTDGVNGATAAFGGMMEKIKGSGGWTATVDSAKSSFRNMSSEIVESVLPSLTSLLRLGTDAMGVVGGLANAFNALPKPIRDQALALGALLVVHQLLGNQLRTASSGGLALFRFQMDAARASAALAGTELTRTRAVMAATAATGRAAADALLGAFGGPVGLAVGAVTTAVIALAGANAEANARVQSLADTLDAQTGALTDNSAAWIANELTRGQSFGLGAGSGSMADLAEEMGVSLETLTKVYEGNAAAAEEARQKSQEWFDAQEGFDPLLRNSAKFQKFNEEIDGAADRLDNARQITEAKREIDAAATDQVDAATGSYRRLSGAIALVAEEQHKARDAAADAARRAFAAATSLTGGSLNSSSERDLEDARDKLTDATNRVRDAEASRQETAEREGSSANDRIRAEEAVLAAREAVQQATEDLADVEARRDPVENYRRRVQEMLETAQNFAANIQRLADESLNGKTLQDLIAAGPEGSKETVDALLADTSLIGLTNGAEEEMSRIGQVVEDQARLAQASIDTAGGRMGTNLGLAMRIAAEEGSASTIEAIATKLGEDPQKIYDIGRTLGLVFLDGLEDAAAFRKTPITMFGDGSFQTGAGAPKGYHTGGIYPGYTPGRDIGLIGVSGGEAIMRPEWTRAVGAGFVHQMNALARSGGVSAVRQAMARYLGGFASGGIAGATPTAAPQVITVPVEVTNERHTPWTIEKAYFTDPTAAEGWGNREKARNNWTGS